LILVIRFFIFNCYLSTAAIGGLVIGKYQKNYFMKCISDHTNQGNSNLFKYCRQKGMLILLFIVVTMLAPGCFQQYYKTNTKQTADAAAIQQLKAADKYFIIHYTDKIMAAQNVQVVNDVFEADLLALPTTHAHYTLPKDYSRNVMKAKHQATALTEVHLYTSTAFNSEQLHTTIPLAEIKRMDVYDKDEKATKENRVTSIIGLSLATIALISVIIVVANPVVNLSGF